MEWLSGSGRTGETPSHYRAVSGKTRLRTSGGAGVGWLLAFEQHLHLIFRNA